jgi:hypothetical protein
MAIINKMSKVSCHIVEVVEVVQLMKSFNLNLNQNVEVFLAF